MAKRQPLLPATRAFVIRLQADADVKQGQWRGRVEHIASYHVSQFASFDELHAFIVKMLSQPEAEA